jgi:hypothetical protein
VILLNPLQWCCTAIQAKSASGDFDEEAYTKDYKAEDKIYKKEE